MFSWSYTLRYTSNTTFVLQPFSTKFIIIIILLLEEESPRSLLVHVFQKQCSQKISIEVYFFLKIYYCCYGITQHVSKDQNFFINVTLA